MQKGGKKKKMPFLIPVYCPFMCMISYAQKKGEKQILSFFLICFY